jgi:hypothetical protein
MPMAWLLSGYSSSSESNPPASNAMNSLKAIKDRIASSRQYAGQDIKKMSEDLHDASDTLILTGQYDHNLTLLMVEAFLEAGGENNKDLLFSTALHQAEAQSSYA